MNLSFNDAELEVVRLAAGREGMSPASWAGRQVMAVAQHTLVLVYDRVLSDAEWSEVAAAMVHAAGIAEHGDEQACRWIAVRHADDHIHIAATLARQDGQHPCVRGDIPVMHTVARGFEARWGLTPMSPLDRTARRRPVTGEAENGARHGLVEIAGTPCSPPSARPPPSPTATPTSSTGSAMPGCACANAWATTAPSSGTRWRCPGTAPTAAPARSGSPDRCSAQTRPRLHPTAGHPRHHVINRTETLNGAALVFPTRCPQGRDYRFLPVEFQRCVAKERLCLPIEDSRRAPDRPQPPRTNSPLPSARTSTALQRA